MPRTAAEKAKFARQRSAGHWLQGAFAPNKGALHRRHGIPEGQSIPVHLLEQDAKSSDKKLALRARAAITAGRISRKHARA